MLTPEWLNAPLDGALARRTRRCRGWRCCATLSTIRPITAVRWRPSSSVSEWNSRRRTSSGG